MEIVLKTVPSLGTNSLLSIFSEERFVINYLARILGFPLPRFSRSEKDFNLPFSTLFNVISALIIPSTKFEPTFSLHFLYLYLTIIYIFFNQVFQFVYLFREKDQLFFVAKQQIIKCIKIHYNS